MEEKKNPSVSAERIAKFLEQTGFVFEMRAKEALVRKGFNCEISADFPDLETGVTREIDILAAKVINEINVHLVIECKQSLVDKWIFICTKGLHYLDAIKHLPRIKSELLKENKMFHHLHALEWQHQLAHNYLCYTIQGDKKAEHKQIDDCVNKLPKALIHEASWKLVGRHLFYPVALFAGQMFSVNYHSSLIVEERDFLSYYTTFTSAAYQEEPEEAEVDNSSIIGPWTTSLGRIKSFCETQMKATAEMMGVHYQIDFVTEKGLDDYVSLIEKEVSEINIGGWPIPPTKK